MRAVRVHEWGVPPVVEDVADPVAALGRTVVRVEAACVAHLDRTIWSGAFLTPPRRPYTPGVEGAGTVVSSERFAPGTRVWLRGGGLGVAGDGTWAELVSAPDGAVGELPDDVPAELGACFFSPSTSAWISLHDVAALRAGERVLVTGATGAVGSLAVQLAREAGATVTAVVSSPERAGEVPQGVATVVLDGDREGPEVDVLVDTVGGKSLAEALACVAPGGRAVVVGYVGGRELVVDLPAFVQRDVALLPLNMVRREQQGRAVAPELLARLADGSLRLPVTTFPLDGAPAALEWLTRRGRSGRAALLPNAGPSVDTVTTVRKEGETLP